MNVHLRACRTRAAVHNEPHRLRFAARGNSSILIGSILLNCSSLDCLTADVVCLRMLLTQPGVAACGSHYTAWSLLWRSLQNVANVHTRHDVHVNNANSYM
jgi:hypothetical protein